MFVLTHSIIHTAKFLFSSEKYYFATSTYSHVSESLKPDDTLILCGGDRQTALFYNMFVTKYRSDLRTNDIFVVNAIRGQTVEIKRLRKTLLNKLGTISFDKTIWGLQKTDVNKHALSDMMFKWQSANLQTQGMAPFYLTFKVKEVIYDDNEQIFIRPDTITF
jgi:hypothetical protein